MTKTELTKLLDQALERLEAVAAEKRLPKRAKEPVLQFVAEARERKATAPSGSGLKPWRIAPVTSKKTGREIVLSHVKVDGGLTPQDQARTGLEFVEEWVEVRASGRVDARERIAAGEGTTYRRTKGGKVKEIDPATA